MDRVICPSCGAPEYGDELPPFHEIAIFTCEVCKVRFVFGRAIPRVVVERYIDNGFAWVRIRWQDPKTHADLHVEDLDPRFAHRLGIEILSVAVP